MAELPKMPLENPVPVCPSVLSPNGVISSDSVLPARLADGSTDGNAPLRPCGLEFGAACSGKAFQFSVVTSPGANERPASVWPPERFAIDCQYWSSQTSEGPAETYCVSATGSRNG